MIKIGFWAQLPPNHPASELTDEGLPWPEFSPNWKMDELLKVVKYLDSGKVLNAYKGQSTCRLCGIQNGSTELTDGKYLWPAGYSHYITEHKVRPPQLFIDWVLSQTSSEESAESIINSLKPQNRLMELAKAIINPETVSREDAISLSQEIADKAIADGYGAIKINAHVQPVVYDGYSLAVQRTASSWDRLSFDEKAAAVRKLTSRRGFRGQ